jgi:hypothetical protein
MYAGSVTAADREEYLLGKPIDRAFLKQDDSKVVMAIAHFMVHVV